MKRFSLTENDKIQLLRISRDTITSYLCSDTIPEIDKKLISDCLMEKTGAFVTIKINGALRGCIGNMKSDKELYKLIQHLVISSASHDYRFMPVKKRELPGLSVEISVLTPMRKIKNIDEIEIGKHGIYLKKGHHTGTFLPKVAIETNWSKEEFLGHCARDKAHIGWDGWKGAEIFIFEALVFSDVEYSEKY